MTENFECSEELYQAFKAVAFAPSADQETMADAFKNAIEVVVVLALRDERDKYRNARHIALELSGVIQEYSAMPCKSLESRMVTTLQRYEARIKELQKDLFADVRNNGG